jgi:hypothetical protein
MKLGFEIFHKEPLEKGLDRGIYKTVGDKEHEQIIMLYVEHNLGMHKISKQLERSSKTVSDHINGHNSNVERIGFCPICKRLDNKYQKVIAERNH